MGAYIKGEGGGGLLIGCLYLQVDGPITERDYTSMEAYKRQFMVCKYQI